jgi:hypothetical protein
MALAFKIKNLNEDKLTARGAPTKDCSGCDPDVPGHQNRSSCIICRGSGREPLSFMSTFTELSESRRAAASDRKRANDNDLYLEY